MANNLKREKQVQVIRSLVEGSSVRSTERMTGIHRDTILRLQARVGEGCSKLMDRELRNLTCRRIQIDEAWGYVGKKQRHVSDEDDRRRVGDFWVFVALDADSKLVPSFRVAKRTREDARAFVTDLASRLSNRIQLSSDHLVAYVDAIDRAFGSNVDYGQIVKFYESEPIGPGRYSPPKCIGAEVTPIWGDPDPAHISTSFVERQNLTMRMNIRRLTRLTNAFSKKPEGLKAAVALHFGYYNFVRRHRSLRVTPAMEAGVTRHLWTLGDLVDCALDLS
jgi:IS1 family transposase